MNEPEIINYQKNNKKISFTLNNVFTAFANAIRRIGTSEIPIVSLETEPYHNSDIKIIDNTTSIHNELLQHRISLIPLNIKLKDVDKYSFKLKKDNNHIDNLNITSNDFIIHHEELDKDFKNGEGDNEINIFKYDEVTKDYPIIYRFKEKIGVDTEKIEVICNPSINIGKNHARNNPTCDLTYNYTVVENIDEIEKEYIENKRKELNSIELIEFNHEKVSKEFNLYKKLDYYIMDNNKNPISFDFELESIGILKPEDIIYRSFVILKYKLDKLKEHIIRIVRSDTYMNGFDIYIKNEDHTIGNLLETYIYQLYHVNRSEDDDYYVKYVSYKIPHPLENIMILRIYFSDENNQEMVENLLYNKLLPELNNNIDNLLSKWKLETSCLDDFNDDDAKFIYT